MPRALRLFATLLVCISMLPGWMEIVENLEHLVHDGHLAHLSDHDGDEELANHQAIEAEHGCTPTNHTCACHTSVPVLLSDAFALSSRSGRLVNARPPSLRVALLHRANAPPVPPPLALTLTNRS